MRRVLIALALLLACGHAGAQIVTVGGAFAPIASPTFTGTVTMPGGGTWASGGINGTPVGATTAANGTFNTLTFGANVGAAFGTVGVGVVGSAFTQTDSTTGAGTVTNAYASKINAVTFATAANAITITNAYGVDFEPPVQGANVTITTPFAANFNGRVNFASSTFYNSATLNQMGNSTANSASGFELLNAAASSTVPTLIPNRSSTTSGIGAAAAGDVDGIAAATDIWEITSGGFFFKTITTGTNADFLCMATGGLAQIQSSACTISSRRFKTDINRFEANVLSGIKKMPVVTFKLKDGDKNKDPNARPVQLGLLAEDVARVAPICAVYENDMRTPKSYRQECLIAWLVKGMQEQQGEIEDLRSQLRRPHG